MRSTFFALALLALLIDTAAADGQRIVSSAHANHGGDDGKILCLAGCGSISPVIVYQRPGGGPLVAPDRPHWKEHTFGVWCADGMGCKAIGNIRIGHRGHGSYYRGDPFWR